MTTRLRLTRRQVLGHRRRVGALDERLPWGRGSLRLAAWAGLQDSMPRAALLSIHARVAGAGPTAWADPSLVQLWGPRYSVFVVAGRDLAPFSLGTMLDDAKGRRRAEDLAARLHDLLGDGEVRMTYAEAGHALGVHPNSLRYAAATGTVLIRWEGARAPTIWTVPPPRMSEARARLELARRYLHVYGPTTARRSADGPGFGPVARRRRSRNSRPRSRRCARRSATHGSSPRTSPASGPIPGPVAPARLLPSGDAYYLLHGPERDLLVTDAARRDQLWTSRVWPGAVLVDGEIVGTWRRANEALSVQPWRRLSRPAREAVEVEAASLPLPGVDRVVVAWDD